MRFSITIQFSQAVQGWRDAYTRQDAYADAGDDGVCLGGTPAADEASTAEYAALEAVLLMPAVTPVEVAEKLSIMKERCVDSCWGKYAEFMARIEADLRGMGSPSVSPAVSAAFADWADAQERFATTASDADDKGGDRMCDAEDRALRKLMDTPCTTPGDLIAKLHAEMVSGNGSAHDVGSVEISNPFAADERQLEGNMAEKHSARALYRDIKDSDLGRLMICLGRTEFDARRWLERGGAAETRLITDAMGKRSLGTGLEGGERETMLLSLLAFDKARMVAVADEIEARHPALVIDAREPVAA